MTNQYQSSNDFKYTAALLKYAPEETQAFIDFDHKTIKRREGNIPIKTRELIALAVASLHNAHIVLMFILKEQNKQE
ncbi:MULTISPECIES: carboxymuconolactone decarboxylase family protein [unclassified Snodgrassella]|uniref:carboxymuconolactone decarboxylase family protein n=1 Tax=unclassified Snodgrassella TaxID=2625236 RepID=UPI0018DB93C5|nr:MULTISPECIES: carboxymuconolactone decarboxylase family protein [Snodgrassella]